MFEIKAADLREGDVFTFDGSDWYEVEALHHGTWKVAVYTAHDVMELEKDEPVIVEKL